MEQHRFLEYVVEMDETEFSSHQVANRLFTEATITSPCVCITWNPMHVGRGPHLERDNRQMHITQSVEDAAIELFKAAQLPDRLPWDKKTYVGRRYLQGGELEIFATVQLRTVNRAVVRYKRHAVAHTFFKFRWNSGGGDAEELLKQDCPLYWQIWVMVSGEVYARPMTRHQHPIHQVFGTAVPAYLGKLGLMRYHGGTASEQCSFPTYTLK